jgi:branched-subunit amino acid ABC-type transport system permease component
MQAVLPGLAAVDFWSLPQQVVNGVLLGAIYALIALGYTMVYGILRLINFAHGEVFMLGAYVALFVSWKLGYSPEAMMAGPMPSNILNLVLMLVASMVVCAVVGVVIEFFAYRPMRNQPRIASLITAIGVSLLLQYGGALFLPVSPPPAIREEVNPFPGAFKVWIRQPQEPLKSQFLLAEREFEASQQALREEQYKLRTGETDPTKLLAKQAEVDAALARFSPLDQQVQKASTRVILPHGLVIMLCTSPRSAGRCGRSHTTSIRPRSWA